MQARLFEIILIEIFKIIFFYLKKNLYYIIHLKLIFD